MLNNLDPYEGPWSRKQATHLLTRTSFGPKRSEIEWSISNGLESTIDRLFDEKPAPDPPIYIRNDRDPEVAEGETWVNTPITPGLGIGNVRKTSLNAWWVGLILNSGISIHERMTLFWHEHFPVTDIPLARQGYHYSNILRNNALGNIRNMVEEITISPAMLVFLNGNENTREAPNENFSRELLELFTIGKGDAAGPGDYTNYTEEDVLSMARALTGWVSRNRENDNEIISSFIPNRHDLGTKILSARFDNAQIENQNEEEYKAVIDIILKKQETARYICRQLHIWFISAEISEEIELNIIEPMSKILFDNNYEIEPALRALLGSNYFNSDINHGCMISSPYDFITKSFNIFELNNSNLELEQQYRIWITVFNYAALQNMELMKIPSVAGWKAYYQSPGFYKSWINAVSLNEREGLIDQIVVEGNSDFNIDFVAFFASLENPFEINELINELVSILFVFPITQNQVDYLKEIVIPGLPDFTWGEQYAEFLNNPSDENLRNAITRKMRLLIGTMLKMPEYYLH